jgi:catechol 2,3-dioxygenase-like lactoylglutathione lyase family enzyme
MSASIRLEVSLPVERMMMVTVQVRDFDAMIAWYHDVLELEVLGLEPDEFCVLRAPHGSTTIGLATDHPDRIQDRPGAGWAPTFAVSEFDAFVGQLRSRGVTFDAEEEGADEGYRLVRIRDPEGNAVGIAAA